MPQTKDNNICQSQDYFQNQTGSVTGGGDYWYGSSFDYSVSASQSGFVPVVFHPNQIDGGNGNWRGTITIGFGGSQSGPAGGLLTASFKPHANRDT